MNVRDRFFDELFEQTKLGKDVMIVSADLGAPSLDYFRRDFPDRFVSVGIAEQNALSVAAGLAVTGVHAIAYGLNPFPVTRAFDQIRNLMASLQIPVTVAALKTGTSTAEAGFSHMALENISLLRSLHGVRLISPSNEDMARQTARLILSKPAPRIVQFDPFISGMLIDAAEMDFEKGFLVIGEEHDTAVVTCGIFANRIREQALPVKLIDCFALPVDEEALVKELAPCRNIISVEDGEARGGLGSMVLEILNDAGMRKPLKRMALRFKDGYPSVLSDRDAIFTREGLTMEAIAAAIAEPMSLS